jgi:hypothetical protein
MESLQQLDSENVRQYAARCRYLELGPGRSLRKLSEQHGFPLNSLKKWSSRFKWSELSGHYDAEMAMQRAEVVRSAHMADALVRSNMAQSLSAIEAQRIASEMIAEKVQDLVQSLLDIALGKIKVKASRVSAVKHALGLIGIVPVKRIEQHAEVSITRGDDALNAAVDDLDMILDVMPLELLHEIDGRIEEASQSRALAIAAETDTGSDPPA